MDKLFGLTNIKIEVQYVFMTAEFQSNRFVRFITDRLSAIELSGFKYEVDVNGYQGFIVNRYPFILVITGLVTGTLPVRIHQSEEIIRAFGTDLATEL